MLLYNLAEGTEGIFEGCRGVDRAGKSNVCNAGDLRGVPLFYPRAKRPTQ